MSVYSENHDLPPEEEQRFSRARTGSIETNPAPRETDSERIGRLEEQILELMQTIRKQRDELATREEIPAPLPRRQFNIYPSNPPSLAGTTIDPRELHQPSVARSRDPYTPMRDVPLRENEADLLAKRTKEPKPADPPTFKGDAKELDEFIVKLNMVFRQLPGRYPTGGSKIDFAIGFLGGRAFKTVSSYLQLDEADQPLFLHDYDAFKRFLKHNFGGSNEKAAAQAALDKLVQTGSASSYFSEFTQYSPLCGFNDEALIAAAKKGLKAKVVERLGILNKRMEFADFNEFRNEAVDADNRLHDDGVLNREDEKRNARKDSRKEPNPGRSERVVTERTKTYEKEVVKPRGSTPYQKGPITDEERKRRRDLDLCTYCGKAGHYASACPVLAGRNGGGTPSVERARNATIEAVPAPTWANKANRTEWVKFRFQGQDPLITVDFHAGASSFTTDALIDSGASCNFIRPSAEVLQHVEAIPYDQPKRLRLVDNQPNPNQRGEITHYVNLIFYVGGHIGPYSLDFDIAEIAAPDIILGVPFVKGLRTITDWDTCEISLIKPDSPLKGTNLEYLERNRFLQRQDPEVVDTDVDPRALRELGLEHDDEEDYDIASEEMRQVIPVEFHDYLDVFRKSDYTSLPPHRSYDHVVELLPNVELKRLKPYPLSAAADKWLKNWIDESRRIGHIEPSSHWFGSPVFLVPKKTPGEFRMVTDFRALNNATKKNAYPLPKINTTLERVSRARFFSKFDMPTSYQLLRMREEDKDWTTILTRYGSFKSRVMREGMTNAGASFQFFMNDVFNPLLDQGVTVYIDDILVYTETREEHIRLIKEVFNRIRSFSLYLKPKKCEFFKSSIEFLGYIIKDGQIAMAQDKLECIRTWPKPTCIKEIQRFLGFTNYYRRFIKGYAGLTLPLVKLTKKSEPWIWDEKQDGAFATLLSSFASEPVLIQADSDETCYLETDASDYAIAAVLSQRYKDEQLHPVGFFSRKLNPAEINYTVHDKELLAIVEGFNHWKPILLGMAKPIEILTDHKNLEYFATNKQLNRRQIRWAETLADFNFSIRYRPGTKGGKPDSLTRRPDYHPGRGGINSFEHNQPNFTTLLPKTLWLNNIRDSELYRRCNGSRYHPGMTDSKTEPNRKYLRWRYGNTDGYMEIRKDGMDGCMDGRMDGCMDGCMDGWTDGGMDGWMDVPYTLPISY